MQLKPNSLLQGGKYRIEKVLGQGGFGITYLATQRVFIDGPIGKIETEIKLAIKEFFMKEYCNRNVQNSYVSVPSDGSKEFVNRFRAKFIKESKTIAALKHPHIIRIYDVFEENGTAYYAMEYVGHGSLSELMKQNGPLEEADALRYIRQIADALGYIHERKMNHLDVKPGNILLDDKMNAVLIDFGLSKRYNEEGNQTSSTPVGISHGYAPMEQYNAGGVGTFSPATDIYSLGATLYKLVTGITPPQANEVFNDGLPAIPSHLSASTVRAITEAMRPGRKERPQSVCEFLKLLDNETDITAEVEDEETVFVADGTELSEGQSSSEKKPSLPKSFRSSFLLTLKNIKKRCGGFLSKKNSIIGSREEHRKRRWTIVSVSLLLFMAFSGFYVYRKYITPPVDYSTVAEAVDLGLSVNWASWNLGASSPDGYGAQLPWGETGTVTQIAYQKKDSGFDADISGGECDVVREKWKDNWRIPTLREFSELKDKCTWEPEIFNGVSGYRIVGPNGNSIFLPDDWVYSSFYITDKLKYEVDRTMGRTFKYWTSWEVSETEAWSHDACHTNKEEKLYIRPVSDNIEKQKKDAVIAEMAKTAISANADKAYIDLGLSVLWATRNLGASNVEDYGDYYSWGETKMKTIYNDSTYSDLRWKDKVVETEYDVAYMNNSNGSRLPTKEEFQELQEKCTWVWGEYEGVNGMIGIGPNGNAIFFPAAGYFYGDAKKEVGTMGIYNSGTGSSNGINKFYFSFSKYGADCVWTSGCLGRSVRPVRFETPSEGNAVDLGLSVKWADRNVGASSPSDCYFAWGETSTKSEYTSSNSVTWKKNIGDIRGNSRYDAARANWGGSWRLPTKAECQELVDKCTWTWTTQGGHNGYKVVGPNGNSIFLPAAGWRKGTSLSCAGECGSYVSSTLSESSTQDAYYLYFDSSDHNVYWNYRYYGRSVRPVSGNLVNKESISDTGKNKRDC